MDFEIASESKEWTLIPHLEANAGPIGTRRANNGFVHLFTHGSTMYIGGGILGTILVILAIIYLARRI